MAEIKFTPSGNGVKVKINGVPLSHVISAAVKFSSDTQASDSSLEYGEEGVSSFFGLKGTCEILCSKLFSQESDEAEISEITVEKGGYRYVLTGCTLVSVERSAELSDGEREKCTYSVSEGKKVKI